MFVDTSGDYNLILDNSVSISVSSSSNDVLSQRNFIRGRIAFGSTGQAIDNVAINYGGMRWWISKEGLNDRIFVEEIARQSHLYE
jgi:hypothetical protein